MSKARDKMIHVNFDKFSLLEEEAKKQRRSIKITLDLIIEQYFRNANSKLREY